MRNLVRGLLLLLVTVSPAQAQYFSLSYTASTGSLVELTNFGVAADEIDICAFDKVKTPETCQSTTTISDRYDNQTSDQYYQNVSPVIGMVRVGFGGQAELFSDYIALRYGLNLGALNLRGENDKTDLDGSSFLYGGELEVALEKGILQVVGFYPFAKMTSVVTPEFSLIMTGENGDNLYRVTRENAIYSGNTYAFGGSFFIESRGQNALMRYHLDIFKELSKGSLKIADQEYDVKNYNIGLAFKVSVSM